MSAVAQEAGQCRCCNAARVHPSYLQNLPSPVYRKHIGQSSLKISTNSPRAQRWFNQGLTHLHGFWEFEAYRCFLEALKYDPDCAMAYWGICMALPGQDNEAGKERKLALETAQGLASKVTAHEQAYLQMVEILISSGPMRAKEVLGKVMIDYPEDTNAIAWWAFWSNEGYQDGKPKRGTQGALDVLEKALKKYPEDIALNHYLIHILEAGPDFAKAMPAAQSLAKVAGDSGHLIHMPGHLYFLAGDYGKACEAFQACEKVEVAYLVKEKIPAIDHVNHLHNLHYLVQAASDHGHLKLASETAGKLAAIVPPEGREQANGTQAHFYYSQVARAIPYIRAREFQKAASVLDEEKLPEKSLARYYLRFLKWNCELKAILLKDGAVSDEEMKKVRALAKKQKGEFDFLNTAEPTFFAESQPLKQARATCRILSMETRALLDHGQLTGGDQFQFAWAYAALGMDKGYVEPPLLVTPVAETLGWLALSKGYAKEAESFFKQALERRPQSGYILSGLAMALEDQERVEEAKKYQDLSEAVMFSAR